MQPGIHESNKNKHIHMYMYELQMHACTQKNILIWSLNFGGRKKSKSKDQNHVVRSCMYLPWRKFKSTCWNAARKKEQTCLSEWPYHGKMQVGRSKSFKIHCVRARTIQTGFSFLFWVFVLEPEICKIRIRNSKFIGWRTRSRGLNPQKILREKCCKYCTAKIVLLLQVLWWRYCVAGAVLWVFCFNCRFVFLTAFPPNGSK